MPLYRVPHTFSHRDGEVAEFPIVAGEGFQFISEARRKMLWEDAPLVRQDIFKHALAFRFRKAFEQKLREIKAANPFRQ